MATPPFRVKAIFDYASPHDDDLSFPNGQIVTVTDEEDADWYYGEYVDSKGSKQEGLFPKNFVERYEPETPPRPSRPARPKKDVEPAQTELNQPPAQEPQSLDLSRLQHVPGSPSTSTVDEPKATRLSIASEIQPPSQAQKAPDVSKKESLMEFGTKPSAPTASKPIVAPVSDKPVSGSFRDRIAAFNKPAAPVAPAKPSGLTQSGGLGFIKKPFVAPPPSKNAYVPPPREPAPQKIYRREEDPAMIASSSSVYDDSNSSANVPSATPETAEQEDQPKPTSLKERIALLQKQQMEQAARHLDAGHKKEKPKRPPKKRTESNQSGGDVDTVTEGHDLETVDTARTNKGLASEQTNESQILDRSLPRRRKSRDTAANAIATSREAFSDGNDADQSGAGETEDGGDVSTGREDIEKPQVRVPMTVQPLQPRSIPQASTGLHKTRSKDDNGAEEDNGEEEGQIKEEEQEDENEDEEEEEEIDPEVKRRLEIRERMAKMSGGMGMAGMFGPPGIVSSATPKKQKSSGTSAKGKPFQQGVDRIDSEVPRTAPAMALPGMQRVQSPEEEQMPVEVTKEKEAVRTSIVQGRQPEEMPDVEDIKEEPIDDSEDSDEGPARIPPVSQNNPKSPVPLGVAPPSLPNNRPIPPAPSTEPRAAPPPPPPAPRSPSVVSESDDEILQSSKRLSLKTDISNNSAVIDRTTSSAAPTTFSPTSPAKAQGTRAPQSYYNEESPQSVSSPKLQMSPTGPSFTSNRASRVPPIPLSAPAPPSPHQTRAPPPPLPTQPPPNRRSTADAKPKQEPEDSEEEITEYDGDYDTDMAPSIPFQDATKSHARQSNVNEAPASDESVYHHSGLPSIGPPPIPSNAPPRAVPPPPPNQPPKHTRKSSDMPRSAPPPPPPVKEQIQEENNDEYDPYSYIAPKQNAPAAPSNKSHKAPATPEIEESYDDLYSASPSRSIVPSPSVPSSQSFAPSPIIPPPAIPPSERPMPRQSLDVLRHTPSHRRSLDASRPSSEQGFIAGDIDLGRSTQWWTQRNLPPPALQNRMDVKFEVEESNVDQQSGAQIVAKQIYVLYMDYSQSTITARFDTKDPSRVELQQSHEPPPTRLRQDQLESAHSMFGARIAEAANSKHNSIVGDGSPFAFVFELIKSLPHALQPVGSRAYGALVYANLANASVQQNDEIRAGDIVSFRNVKVQGHRGPVKQKYNMEVGKPDHVGIVVDWDGTKKKVRAWEQGRESRKVKMESFKLGDLRSGEVKVWRVMSRSWVGWGEQS